MAEILTYGLIFLGSILVLKQWGNNNQTKLLSSLGGTAIKDVLIETSNRDKTIKAIDVPSRGALPAIPSKGTIPGVDLFDYSLVPEGQTGKTREELEMIGRGGLAQNLPESLRPFQDATNKAVLDKILVQLVSPAISDVNKDKLRKFYNDVLSIANSDGEKVQRALSYIPPVFLPPEPITKDELIVYVRDDLMKRRVDPILKATNFKSVLRILQEPNIDIDTYQGKEQPHDFREESAEDKRLVAEALNYLKGSRYMPSIPITRQSLVEYLANLLTQNIDPAFKDTNIQDAYDTVKYNNNSVRGKRTPSVLDNIDQSKILPINRTALF